MSIGDNLLKIIKDKKHLFNTFHSATGIYNKISKCMVKKHTELWCDATKEMCSLMCYLISSKLQEKNPLTYDDIRFITCQNFSNEELEELELLIHRNLNYNTIIYV
jgi:hypothetical protein